MNLAELNARFAIPVIAQIIPASGNLPAIQISGPTTATIYLHGAHVANWKPPHSEEVLWLSQKSLWQPDKPIRGGIPICFPWFGPRKDHPESAAHGFARIKPFTLESLTQQADSITITLALTQDAATLNLWPHPFTLRHRITIGPELTTSLELTNTGSTPLTAELALHTYFSISDIRQIKISGLDQTRYIDKTDALKEKTQSGDITLSAETDRVYLNTTTPITIHDPAKNRRITLTKQNSRNTVVWNPWIAKAKAMPDFGDEEWPNMLCVETANVAENAPTLAPGQSHLMSARLQVQ